MKSNSYPELDVVSISDTRNAIHAYSRVLGNCLKAFRPKRKHWWHASLRPSLRGLSTGIVRASTDFEIEIDLLRGSLMFRTADGNENNIDLLGQPAVQVASFIVEALNASSIDDAGIQKIATAEHSTVSYPDYRKDSAAQLGDLLAKVSAELETFRAGIREESSPVQLWPHHFDLSMIWLPGELIDGQDTNNEEYADKQMNFGFSLGDDANPEPYFYVSAYPASDALAATALPAGSAWSSSGFNGVVLRYGDLVAVDNPSAYLQGLWSLMISAGRKHMLADIR